MKRLWFWSLLALGAQSVVLVAVLLMPHSWLATPLAVVLGGVAGLVNGECIYKLWTLGR